MSQVMSVKDVLAISCPTREARYSIVQTPKSGGTYTATATIPEADFQKTMANKAASLAKAPANLGARNELVRGVMIKPETFATLEIDEANKGMEADMRSLRTPKFSEFLLQSVNEVTEERYQLVETFGDTIGFFFGTRPKIYQYSGVLLNTTDYAWRDNWKDKYENEFKGTKCVEAKKRAYLTYDYVLREGYILGMSIGQVSANPNNVDFNFTMFITRELNLQPTNFQQIQTALREERALGNTSDITALREKWMSANLPPEKFVDTYGELGAEGTSEVAQEALRLQYFKRIADEQEEQAAAAEREAEAKDIEQQQISELSFPLTGISKTPLGTNNVSGGAAGSRDNPDPSAEDIQKVLSYNSGWGALTPLGM